MNGAAFETGLIVKINSQNFNRCPYLMRKVTLIKKMSTNSKDFNFIIVDLKVRKFREKLKGHD